MNDGTPPAAGMDHPYGMVAAAFGLGFVLGGGVSLRFAARLAGFGLRLGWRCALPALKRDLTYAFTSHQPQRNERQRA